MLNDNLHPVSILRSCQQFTLKMQRVVKKRLTLLIGIVIIVVSYILCRRRTYDHEESVIIQHVPPADIWEFVADFSNMKYLNPTIVDFNILSESGNYQRWQYSIEYTEHLSHWPYLTNTAVAHFDVLVSERNTYYILSNHHTCLLGGLLCLKSSGEFKFSKGQGGTVCVEKIQYECPFLMARFCEREVRFQRKSIFENLKLHFEK